MNHEVKRFPFHPQSVRVKVLDHSFSLKINIRVDNENKRLREYVYCIGY